MELDIKCVQINLQHSIAASSGLNNCLSNSVDVCFIQEPYCIGRKIVCFKNNYRMLYDNKTKPYSAIIISNKNLPAFFHQDISSCYVTCVEIGSGRSTIIIISIYCPPSVDIKVPLYHLERALVKNRGKKIVVAGDFNAHSDLWTDQREDHRGRQLLEFLSMHDLVLNNVIGISTFESAVGESCIDLTLSNIPAYKFLVNWTVSEKDSLSDHKYITFSIVDEFTVNDNERRYAVGRANWELFSQNLKSSLNQINYTEIENSIQATSLASQFISNVNDICLQSIPSRETKRKSVPWWTSELTRLRKENNRLRRVYQRTKNLVLRNTRREVYLLKQNEYKNAIKFAKTNSWKHFCTESSRNPWGFVYKMCTNKLRTPSCFKSININGSYTTDLETTLTVLMNKFFPDDSICMDNNFHGEIRCQSTRIYNNYTDDPPFTVSEVKHAVFHLAKGKAPGHDRITSEIVHQVFTICPQELTNLYNTCLKFGVFPKEWKSAVVVVIPKGSDIDSSDIHSYRPICLLPLFGKILDRLMINRINWHMEINSILSEKQFGFRRQKSAEDALYVVTQKIKSYLQNFKYVAAISLDITGAFDNAWWPMILFKLREMNCPKNLYNLVSDYFREREAHMTVGSTHVIKNIVRGCPQGSISGPTFWNILFNDFLLLEKDSQVFDIAFADDSILIFPANSREEIETKGSSLLNMVVEWGNKYKLSFNPRKTKCIIFTPPYSRTDLYRRSPVIKMNDQSIPVVKDFKYLGVIFDNKLSWKQHVLMIKKKTISIFNALAVIARSTWGLSTHATRILYDSVFISIMTYGCNVWAEATDKLYIKRHLFSAQRIAALRITRAYRTTSIEALCVLAGIAPIDLILKQKMLHYCLRKGFTIQFNNMHYEEATYEMNIKWSSLDNPWSRYSIPEASTETIYDYHVFTDGSRSTTGVGASFVVFDIKGDIIHTVQYGLGVKCSSFQAEMFALFESIKWCGMKNKDQKFRIYCDSKAAISVLRNTESLHPMAHKIRLLFHSFEHLKNNIVLSWIKSHVGHPGNEYADLLAKLAASSEMTSSYDIIPQSTIKYELFHLIICTWQNRWNVSHNGRLTYEFFPQVQNRLQQKDLHINFELSQFFSGHGRFKQYLHRFALHDSPACLCGALEETSKHIIFECTRFCNERMDLEITARLLGFNWPCHLKFLISEKQLFDKFLKFISSIYDSI